MPLYFLSSPRCLSIGLAKLERCRGCWTPRAGDSSNVRVPVTSPSRNPQAPLPAEQWPRSEHEKLEVGRPGSQIQAHTVTLGQGRDSYPGPRPNSFIIFLLNHMSPFTGWPALLITLGSILEMLVRAEKEGLRVKPSLTSHKCHLSLG